MEGGDTAIIALPPPSSGIPKNPTGPAEEPVVKVEVEVKKERSILVNWIDPGVAGSVGNLVRVGNRFTKVDSSPKEVLASKGKRRETSSSAERTKRQSSTSSSRVKGRGGTPASQKKPVDADDKTKKKVGRPSLSSSSSRSRQRKSTTDEKTKEPVTKQEVVTDAKVCDDTPTTAKTRRERNLQKHETLASDKKKQMPIPTPERKVKKARRTPKGKASILANSNKEGDVKSNDPSGVSTSDVSSGIDGEAGSQVKTETDNKQGVGADTDDNNDSASLTVCGSTPCVQNGIAEFPCRRCHRQFYCSGEHRAENAERHSQDCKFISQLDADLLQTDLEYRSWITHSAPYLYDVFLNFVLVWPSLTVQWLPEIIELPEYIQRHKLIIGTQTSGETNHLLICGVDIPQHVTLKGKSTTDNSPFPFRSHYEGELNVLKRINHEREVHRARYMPQNANIIATKSPSNDVFIFDCGQFPELPSDEMSRPTYRLRGHTKEGFGLAWSPLNKGKLASGSNDGIVCFWDINKANTTLDAETGDQIIEASSIRKHHSDIVEDVDWHCFSNHVAASCGDDKNIVVWDTRSDPPAHCVKNAHTADIYSISFSPFSEHTFATGSSDQSIKIWDIRNLNAAILSMDGAHESAVLQVQWSPHSSTLLASCSHDRKACIWDISIKGHDKNDNKAESRKEDVDDDLPKQAIFLHGGHVAQISDISWHPGKEGYLASVSEDNNLQVWQKSHILDIEEEGDKEERIVISKVDDKDDSIVVVD